MDDRMIVYDAVPRLCMDRTCIVPCSAWFATRHDDLRDESSYTMQYQYSVLYEIDLRIQCSSIVRVASQRYGMDVRIRCSTRTRTCTCDDTG